MRQPLSTQLLAAQQHNSVLTHEISALTIEVEKLKELVKSKDNYNTTMQKEKLEALAEIEQLHQFLDTVPNSPPREKEGKESWNTTKLLAMTRLAAWLGGRQ